jgi:hypothetical protein
MDIVLNIINILKAMKGLEYKITYLTIYRIVVLSGTSNISCILLKGSNLEILKEVNKFKY